MRLPKKVWINNIPFKILRDRKSFGCNFSYKKGLISVGTQGCSREHLEGFLHEVAEISAIERGMRASKCKPMSDTDEFVFHGSHNDFRDMITDVSIIVGDLLKLEK